MLRKQILWTEFRQRYSSGSTVKCESRRKEEEGQGYTDFFLCPARVYAFAEKYDIPKLRALALHKLQQTLEGYHVHRKRVRDIVSLVQYAYSNDNTRDSGIGQGVDELRRLAVHYIRRVA